MITAGRLSGNRYGVGVLFANGEYTGPLSLPENDRQLQFDPWMKWPLFCPISALSSLRSLFRGCLRYGPRRKNASDRISGSRFYDIFGDSIQLYLDKTHYLVYI